MGAALNPLDLVRVERVRGRGPLRIQALVARDFTYKVSRLVDRGGGCVEPKDEVLPRRLVEAIFREVALRQEPKASKPRLDELVSRLIDRSWNAPVLFLNVRTGEVTT